MPLAPNVEIVTWRSDLKADYERLGTEWISSLFGPPEPEDLRMFADPEAYVIRPGGQIWFALDAAHRRAVGTVSALRLSPTRFELAKMAVAADYRRMGIGEALARTVIEHVRQAGAQELVLESHSSLEDALRLYRRLGFQSAERDFNSCFARCNVFMRLDF